MTPTHLQQIESCICSLVQAALIQIRVAMQQKSMCDQAQCGSWRRGGIFGDSAARDVRMCTVEGRKQWMLTIEIKTDLAH